MPNPNKTYAWQTQNALLDITLGDLKLNFIFFV
jgi:hypothetical protein